MLLILEAILPVVAIAALGYLCRVLRIFSEVETAAIERIAFWYLIPCLLFYGTATASFPEEMNWRYFIGFYLCILLVYITGMLLGKFLFGSSLKDLTVIGMAGAYSNVTVLGIPITLQILGDAAFVPMLVVIAVHNLVLFGFGTILTEIASSNGGSLRHQLLRIAKEVVLNPISASLLAGAAWNLAGFTFISPLAATFELIRPAAIPAALFALGAGIHRYHIRGELGLASLIVVLKLLFMPLLMWWLLHYVFAVDLLWARTAVMLGAMPVGISVYVFSRRYQRLENAVATSIVLACLGSVFSIGFFVWLTTP